MNGEVIKSFLVGLGFGVDDASLSKFNRSIASATLKVSALYAATEAMGAGIVFGLSKISEGFENIGYEYKILAPAINKALILRQELLKAYGAAGVNLNKVIQDSVRLNISLTKTKYAFDALYKGTAAKFFNLLTQQSDKFRQQIYANMPKIQHTLEAFIKSVFKAVEAATSLGLRLWSILERVYEFFVLLDNKTNGWSTIILAVIAAWKLLNLEFLATPLGQLLALGGALLALYDDLRTFKEGGKSLIDWGSEMTKIIVGMVAGVTALTTAIVALASVYTLWTNATKIATAAQAALDVVLNANPIGLLVLAVSALTAGITALDAKWNVFGGHVTGFFSSLGGKVLDFIGGGNPAANIRNAGPAGIPLSPAYGGGGSSNQSSAVLHQQTNIYTQPGADATTIGKVSSSDTMQNFNTAGNLAPVTR